MALRNQSSRGKRSLKSDRKLVPYIVVMQLLVVILMLASPSVTQTVDYLPYVKKAGKAPTENIQVVVHADSRLSIKTKSGLHPVDMPQLVNNVKTAQAGLNTPVVIAADRDVRYEQVIDVMKALQGANVERVGQALQIEGGRQ